MEFVQGLIELKSKGPDHQTKGRFVAYSVERVVLASVVLVPHAYVVQVQLVVKRLRCS